MPKLLEYYNKWQSKLQKLSFTTWTLLTLIMTFLGGALGNEIPNALAKWASNTTSSWLSSLLNSPDIMVAAQGLLKWLLALAAPTAIVVSAYNRILNRIDTKSWKRKFPEYDIGGEWKDTTTYTKSLEGAKGWEETQIIGKSTVIFEQTCRQIKILPSDGTGFKWQSIVVDWDAKDELHILYDVEYRDNMQQNAYPASRTGYEKMHIDRTGLSAKQKPHKMSGQFWHCIQADGNPMYLGDVVYERTI